MSRRRTMNGTPLSAADLRRVSEFLYQLTGMTFGENKRYYIERRIADGLAASGAANLGDYLNRLAADRGAAEKLVNSFTVNETYFYREEHQLQALGRSMLPEIVSNRQPGDLVRIWSMPCSTGEEAYSIAIWLLENWAMVDAYHIEIIGSDVDTAAIAAAKAGVYGERSLSRLPERVVASYFEPPKAGARKIIDDLRESVHFTTANLIDPASMRAVGRFDIIFCRNLLIYFDDASRAVAADHLFDCLNPGGFLCLGHTESMSRISGRFTTARFPDAIVYRRP
jgi:chemotaxis protein methyltransferase CheR